MMKYARYLLTQLLACALAIAPIPSFAQQSNPGFTFGQIPTTAQWNSYFSGKLDYNANGLAVALGGIGATDGPLGLVNLAGAATSGQYLRGNGTRIVLSALSSSDIPGLAGGVLGSLPYQTAPNVTTFLAGNATTATMVLTSIGVAGVATAPTWASGTGTGLVVQQSNPTINTPTMAGGSLTGASSVTSSAMSTGTLAASGAVSGAGFSAYLASPPAIGTTTPAAVKSTTLQATSTFSMTGLVMSATAPTIASGCGGGGSSIAAPNGTSSFTVTTAGDNFCTLTMPAAATGWNCFANNRTTPTSTNVIKQTAGFSTTSVTLSNYNNAGTLTTYGSIILGVICMAY